MTTHIPKHIAIIPDGNRRWAKAKGLPTIVGHQRGYENAVKLSKKARDLGIITLTFWAFSTENWNRSKDEVSYLMKIFESFIDRHLADALKNQTRLTHIGRKDRLPKGLLEKIIQAQEKTKSFSKHFLNIALDYGGHDEIIRAIEKIIAIKGSAETITPEEITKNLDIGWQSYPNPDLIIRPGGEKRLSGFMLWQSEYSELLFPDVLFPDFTPEKLEEAIEDFIKRQRRFGR